MIDRDQADDKIIAVMFEDAVYGGWTDIKQCPVQVLERLKHYFLTYKELPSEKADGEKRKVEIAASYSADEAHEVIRLSMVDYQESRLAAP